MTYSDSDYPRYLVLKRRMVPCFGVPGSIYEWDTWRTYTDKTLRDKEYARLCVDHPLEVFKTEDQLFPDEIRPTY